MKPRTFAHPAAGLLLLLVWLPGPMLSAEVLVLKDNRCIDQVTIVRNDQGTILYNRLGCARSIDQDRIVKVTEQIPLGATLLTEEEISTMESAAAPSQASAEVEKREVDVKPHFYHPGPASKVVANKAPKSVAETNNAWLGKIMLAPKLAYNAYSMGDLNEFIRSINSWADRYGLSGEMSEITGGFNLGGGMQVGIASNLILGLDIEYLTTETHCDYTYRNYRSTFDITNSLAVCGGTVKILQPLNSQTSLTGTIGVDLLTLSGKISSRDNTTSDELPYSGSDIGLKCMLGIKTLFSEKVGADFELGYRSAKINKVSHNNQVMTTRGRNFTIDFSGVFFQIILDIILNPDLKKHVTTNIKDASPVALGTGLATMDCQPTEEIEESASSLKTEDNKLIDEKIKILKELLQDGIITEETYRRKLLQL